MSDKTKIEWTEATWNPTTGCSKISPGCKHCYAKRDWARLSKNPKTVYFGREFENVATLVWDKVRMGAGPLRGLRPRYELCALFMHDGFKIQNRRLTDIWPEPIPHRKPTGHKSEKPVGLIKKLIAESGGDLILDPFVGSGTSLVAAKQLGKQVIGIEIEERWCEVAARRAEKAEVEAK